MRKIFKILTATVFVGTLIYILTPQMNSMFSSNQPPEEALESLREKGSLSENRPDSPESKLFNEKTIDWKAVRSALPENRAPMTREESEVFRENRAKLQALRAKITSNKATDEEINSYYREQTEITRDMVDFYEYLLENYDSKLEERTLKKYTFLKEQFEHRLARIPRKKEEAVKRISEYRGKTGQVK